MKAKMIDIMILDAVVALLMGVAVATSGCGNTTSYDDSNYTNQAGVEDPASEDTAPEADTEADAADAASEADADDAAADAATDGVVAVNIAADQAYEARLDDDNKVLVSVSHPTLSVAEDTGYDALRDALDQATTAMQESATAAADEYEQYAKDAIKDGYWNEGGYYSYQMTPEVTRADSTAVSVLVNVYANRGGVHPDTWYETYNYDAQTGERLMIHDVLQDGQYEQLAERLATALKDKYTAETFFDGDPTSLLQQDVGENQEFRFTLGQQGITFYFAAYELAPYAAGSQQVTFSYKDVPGLVKEQYQEAPADYITTVTDWRGTTFYDADGKAHTLALTMDNTSYQDTDDVYDLTISIDGNDLVTKEVMSLGETAYLVHQDGKNFLYLELSNYNDWKSIDVYNLNQATPVKMGSIDRWFRNGTGSDPNRMELGTRTNLLSTNEVWRTYKVGSNGVPEPTMDYDYIVGTISTQLTTKVDLTAQVRDIYDGDSKEETLPAGTVLIFYATDGESWVDFQTQDGHYVRIENISTDNWPYTVDGVDAETLFDGMAYAG